MLQITQRQAIYVQSGHPAEISVVNKSPYRDNQVTLYTLLKYGCCTSTL